MTMENDARGAAVWIYIDALPTRRSQGCQRALALSVLVGMLSGLLPANRAARMDPVTV